MLDGTETSSGKGKGKGTAKSEGKGREALVVMGGPADAELAVHAMNRKSVGGQQLEVTEFPIYDLG
jgi:hypothetical protein